MDCTVKMVIFDMKQWKELHFEERTVKGGINFKMSNALLRVVFQYFVHASVHS